MSRIYWRIFLSFWAVILVTTALTVGIGLLMLAEERDENRRAFLRGSLGELSREAQQVLDEGGEQTLRTWLQSRQADLPAPVLIITPDDRELLDRALPPVPLRMLRRRAERPGGPGPPVRRLRGPGGSNYLLLPAPPREGRLGRWFGARGARPLFFLILVLVSGVVCFWLARYLTRPLESLRTAGQAIASGDLGARAGAEARERSDEIGDLARDFDQMAERVQQLIESQRRLMRDVSHELRSPLTRLQTASGLLRQATPGGEQANLDRIDKEVAHLDSLIGQILAYARLAHLESPVRAPVDLVRLLDSIADDARYEGRARGIEVRADLPDRATIDGELELLRSALENVVRNAVQHAQHEVTVQATRTPAGLLIIVRDDGPGVAEGELGRLFEPFYTGNDSGTRSSGIGLAITRRAVALHGGSVRASNLDGAGLAVEISLPTAN